MDRRAPRRVAFLEAGLALFAGLLAGGVQDLTVSYAIGFTLLRELGVCGGREAPATNPQTPLGCGGATWPRQRQLV